MTDAITPERAAELLACPFCGGLAARMTITGEDEFHNVGGDIIYCTTCDACTRVFFGKKEGITEAWNKRQQHDRIAALEAEQRTRAMDLLSAHGETEEALKEIAALEAEVARLKQQAEDDTSTRDAAEDLTSAYLAGAASQKNRIAALHAARDAAEERGAEWMRERAARMIEGSSQFNGWVPRFIRALPLRDDATIEDSNND